MSREAIVKQLLGTQFIAELGEDAARREELARGARRAFEEHWTEEVVIEQYLDVVRQAAQNKGNVRVISALGGKI